jgi:hypothetical protein
VCLGFYGPILVCYGVDKRVVEFGERNTLLGVAQRCYVRVLVVGGEQLFRPLLNLGLVARIPPIRAATDPQFYGFSRRMLSAGERQLYWLQLAHSIGCSWLILSVPAGAFYRLKPSRYRLQLAHSIGCIRPILSPAVGIFYQWRGLADSDGFRFPICHNIPPAVSGDDAFPMDRGPPLMLWSAYLTSWKADGPLWLSVGALVGALLPIYVPGGWYDMG